MSLQRELNSSKMVMLKLIGLLVSAAVFGTEALPLAHVHVKFVQPPHVQEHRITTDGGQLIGQQSYLSIGRRLTPVGLRNQRVGKLLGGIEYQPLYAQQRGFNSGVAGNELAYGDAERNHVSPDFSNGLEYPDPYLLTGEQAMRAVGYLYSRGELFFQDIPHYRALMANQELRRANGLNGNILQSIRPGSPWLARDD